jgi:hypothetical protein
VADGTRSVDYARRHIRFGWWSLLAYATLGLALESLHGFKVRAYLDVANETRRLTWTLAHAHGTGLSLINIVFGLSVRIAPELSAGRQHVISPALIGAAVLMPVGFFLGGIAFYGGDPGVGILLLPVGAFLLIAALYWTARAAGSRHAPSAPEARTRTARR